MFFKFYVVDGSLVKMSPNEPQLREVREFHKTKFKENPKTQAKHFGFCKFNIFYKTKCNCDLKSQNLKKSLYTAFCETDVSCSLNYVKIIATIEITKAIKLKIIVSRFSTYD